jgi:hypothetical protein
MQEVWLCEACGAVNRGSLAICYRCEWPRSTPAPSASHGRSGAAAAPATPRYIPAWPLGYLAAAVLLLQVLLQVGVMAAAALQIPHLISPDMYAVSDGSLVLLGTCAMLYVLAFLVSVPLHGAFLALTAYNVPALGGGTPQFGPMRAFFWWIEAGLWAWRAYLTAWVPIGIGFLVGGFVDVRLAPIVAIVALLFFVIAFGYPVAVLRRAGRLLEDLTLRLSPSATASELAGKWSAAWAAARVCELLVPVVFVMWLLIAGALLIQVRLTAGGSITNDQASSVIAAATAVVVALVLLSVAAWVANARALWVLMRITVALSHARRVAPGVVPARGAPYAGAATYSSAAAYSGPATPPGLAPPVATPAYLQLPPAPADPSPAIPRPRWLRTPPPAEDDRYERAHGDEAPQYFEQPPAAEPPPADQPDADSAPVVLLPSSRSVSRYGSGAVDAYSRDVEPPAGS